MALIRDYTTLADVTMVDSVAAAIASFNDKQPDLIVAPTLLSLEDSDQLTSHVKWEADPHVQMLTIPALDMLRESEPEVRRRFAFFRRRRPLSLGLQYDPGMVGRQIAERLERAVTLREERGTSLDIRALVRRPAAVAFEPVRSTLPVPFGATAKFQNRAARTPQRGPWLWVVRLPWGNDVELVNISRTGVLLETASRLTPGMILELQLNGMGQNRTVMARFVRSEVARDDGSALLYHAAAQFEEPLDMLVADDDPFDRDAYRATPMVIASVTPQSLTDLFSTVMSDRSQSHDACNRFARGLGELIGARDVLVRPTPIVPDRDCESIFFRVNGDDRSGMILQVLFDRNRSVTTTEFRLLKAATGLASALLELDAIRVDERRSTRRLLAEVA
jgi:hypothetical protein